MPETKQVGFRCHAPDQERREFHPGHGLARPPTAWPREERAPPPVPHGESHRRPGGHFGAGPARGEDAPTTAHAEYPHSQKPPPLHQLDGPEITASAPRPAGQRGAQGTTHQSRQPGSRAPSGPSWMAGTLCREVWQARAPRDRPFSSWQGGEGPAGDMLRAHVCPCRPEHACLVRTGSPGRSG